MEELLNLYCIPFTHKERCYMHKLWLNAAEFKCEKTNNLYINLLIEAIQEIYTQLNEIHFYTYNNFASACSAFISIMCIYHVNMDIKTLSVDKLDLLIKYILLYIYIDHTLDEDKDHLSNIRNIFYEMVKNPDLSENEIIKLKNKYKITNIPLQKSIDYLYFIFKKSPKSIPYLIEVARIEFETFDIQTNEHDTLKTCYLKGETSTMAGISVMINDKPPEGTDIMGRLGQLYDDIVDLEEDIKYNIRTYVTECYLKYNNINLILEIFVNEFSKLSEVYRPIKSLILYTLCTFLLSNCYISKEIRLKLQNYSLLLYSGSFKSRKIFYFF